MEKHALSLGLMWKEIKQRIDLINFAKLWAGFRAYPFAVYNKEQVCLDGELIPKTEEFLANCAINYKGKWIAIFMVDGTEDLDMMASKIIHEMFHAFQMENQDERFPNEIKALFEYEYSLENLSGKYRETTASSEEQSRKVELALANYRKVQDEKIAELSKHKPILEGEYKILGVNVYNAWFYKNHLYTTYFLAYEDEGEQKILHGNYFLEIAKGKIGKVYAEKQ